MGVPPGLRHPLPQRAVGVGISPAASSAGTTTGSASVPTTARWRVPSVEDMTTSAAEVAPRRHVTAARVVAVAIIVLLAAGVVVFRAAGAHEAVHVPTGAQSGDLRLHSCHYDTEDGSYAADCGTLVVPENRLDPGSRLIALPVTRVRATGSHQAGPGLLPAGRPGRDEHGVPVRQPVRHPS